MTNRLIIIALASVATTAALAPASASAAHRAATAYATTNAPAHAAQPYVPQPRHVNFAEGTAPGSGPENQITGQAAYAWDTNTIYHQGQLGKFARGHEMGHALDGQILNNGDRNKFMRIMGLPGPWNQGTGFDGLRSPSEFFADWYGNAVVGNDPSRAWNDAYAPAPTPKQFRLFTQAVARLGRRNQLPGYTPR